MQFSNELDSCRRALHCTQHLSAWTKQASVLVHTALGLSGDCNWHWQKGHQRIDQLMSCGTDHAGQCRPSFKLRLRLWKKIVECIVQGRSLHVYICLKKL